MSKVSAFSYFSFKHLRSCSKPEKVRKKNGSKKTSPLMKKYGWLRRKKKKDITDYKTKLMGHFFRKRISNFMACLPHWSSSFYVTSRQDVEKKSWRQKSLPLSCGLIGAKTLYFKFCLPFTNAVHDINLVPKYMHIILP